MFAYWSLGEVWRTPETQTYNLKARWTPGVVDSQNRLYRGYSWKLYCTNGGPPVQDAAGNSGGPEWLNEWGYVEITFSGDCATGYTLSYVAVEITVGGTDGAFMVVPLQWSVARWDAQHSYADGEWIQEFCQGLFDQFLVIGGDRTFGETFPEFVGPGGMCEGRRVGSGGPFDLTTESATEFGIVCSGAPEFSWTSVAWVGPWIGHYAACLFNPQGGMDVEGIEAAAADTALGDVSTAFEGFEGVQFSGTCGVLYSGSVGSLGQVFTISTCDSHWQEFAGVRTILGIGVIVGGILVSLKMIIAAVGVGYFGLGGGEG